MNVNNTYLFQSPYHSQTQVGRPDPSAKQDESTIHSTQKESDEMTQETQKMQEVEAIESTKNSNSTLDLYA